MPKTTLTITITLLFASPDLKPVHLVHKLFTNRLPTIVHQHGFA